MKLTVLGWNLIYDTYLKIYKKATLDTKSVLFKNFLKTL